MVEDCELEKHQQSVYSPSKVGNAECLLYCLVEPDEIEGEIITPRAFGKSRLRNGELSVVRKSFSSTVEIEIKVVNPQLARNPERSFRGCLLANVANIREITADGHRAVCVVDDGEVEFASHAHLAFSDSTIRGGKSVQVAVRENLLDVFDRAHVLSLVEAFMD